MGTTLTPRQQRIGQIGAFVALVLLKARLPAWNAADTWPVSPTAGQAQNRAGVLHPLTSGVCVTIYAHVASFRHRNRALQDVVVLAVASIK